VRTLHDREIGEPARVVGDNLQQPRHLIELFHVGYFANGLRRTNAPSRKSPPASPPVIVCGLRFRGLRCGKSSIPVWLGAQGAGVQFTSLADRCATGITGPGQYLFPSEFFGLHNRIMQHSTAGGCSILLIFNTLAKASGTGLGQPGIFLIVSKSEHPR
jgi:hypothetical protein